MAPPDTNLEKQKRRHGPVLWGIVAAAALAVIGWVAYNSYIEIPDEAASGDDVVQVPIEAPETSTATSDAGNEDNDTATATDMDSETETGMDADNVNAAPADNSMETDTDTATGTASGTDTDTEPMSGATTGTTAGE